MQMIGKYGDRIYMKRMSGPNATERFAQSIDVINQKRSPAIQQIHREEKRTALNPPSPVIGHDAPMLTEFTDVL